MITVNQDIYALDENGYRDFVQNNYPNVNPFDAWMEASKRAEAQIEFLKRQHEKEKREAFDAGWAARSQLNIGQAARTNQIDIDYDEFKYRHQR